MARCFRDPKKDAVAANTKAEEEERKKENEEAVMVPGSIPRAATKNGVFSLCLTI